MNAPGTITCILRIVSSTPEDHIDLRYRRGRSLKARATSLRPEFVDWGVFQALIGRNVFETSA
jgi:hypothetical protein